jgi:lambda repressor-like predicted transcriptional regulator
MRKARTPGISHEPQQKRPRRRRGRSRRRSWGACNSAAALAPADYPTSRRTKTAMLPSTLRALLRRPMSALSMRYYSSAEVVARLHKLLAHSSRMQLAREAGVSDEYLRKILHGERPPGPKVLEFLGFDATPYFRLKRT